MTVGVMPVVPPQELPSSTVPIVTLTLSGGMPQSESKSFISFGVAPLIRMYTAIMVKLLSGAELNVAICAGVVFLSATNIDLAVARVVTRLALLATIASLTSLLYAVTARAANRMTSVITMINSVIVNPPCGK